MKYSDLVGFNGGVMELNEKNFVVPGTPAEGSSKITSFGISAGGDSKAGQILGTKVLKVAKSDSGTGMWIPYFAKCIVYDFLSGGQTWAASGPFSGCYYEIGQSGGRVYVAHVACEGSNDPAVINWPKVLPDRTVLFRAKMSMSLNLPAGTTNAAAIAFASITGTSVDVTRVDVQTSSPGGMSGKIFDVKQVPNAA